MDRMTKNPIKSMSVTVGLSGNRRGTLKKGLRSWWECESEYGVSWNYVN